MNVNAGRSAQNGWVRERRSRDLSDEVLVRQPTTRPRVGCKLLPQQLKSHECELAAQRLSDEIRPALPCVRATASRRSASGFSSSLMVNVVIMAPNGTPMRGLAYR